jgi:hypothetical protein
MAVCRRVALFEREIRVSLATSAIEVLFEHAGLLSEGQREGGRWFGSTMITFDLERAGSLLGDPCDAASARRVAELLAGDARVVARARSLASAAAADRAGGPLAGLTVEVKARAAGRKVHLDVDVEGALA